MDDCGFVAVSRWYAAWQILSRDKAWPVEYRGCNASRARASRKIGRGRQMDTWEDLVCALSHSAPRPTRYRRQLGEAGEGLPFANRPAPA